MAIQKNTKYCIPINYIQNNTCKMFTATPIGKWHTIDQIDTLNSTYMN